MPGAVGEVQIEGLHELQLAFGRMSKELQKELRAELAVAAEGVRFDAEKLARENISHIGKKWSKMRIGVSSRLVYVAPVKRGIKSGPKKRPNLFGLLLDKSLEPALVENIPEIEKRVEFMLDTLGSKNGFY